MERRTLLKGLGTAALAPALGMSAFSRAGLAHPGPGHTHESAARDVVRPKRLKQGDTVCLVAPASVTYERDNLNMARESLQALGLKVKVGAHVLTRYGYFAGEDKDRAADINAAFADPEVDGIIALRGGWGAVRTLPYIDFDVIAANPKVFMGYSDITTLLNAIYARTGLTTFHGPTAMSAWIDFTTAQMRRVVFDGDTPIMKNPQVARGTLAVRTNRIQTITPGVAQGRLVGGNLTLLSNLVGTGYFPDVTGHIVFIEEVGEYVYRCDRMLAQLMLAGVFEKASAIVLGGFTDCGPEKGGYGNFALMDVFEHYFKGLNKPVFSGAMIGHISHKRTIPIGTPAEIDAAAGTIRLTKPAVL